MTRFSREEVLQGFSACRLGNCHECPYADYAVNGECNGAEMILDDLYFYLTDEDMESALKEDSEGRFYAKNLAKKS